MNSLEKWLEPYTAVLVTGGSSGIGCSFLTVIRKVYRNRLVCNISRSRPHNFPDSALTRHFACDMSDRQAVEEAVPRVVETLRESGGPGKILFLSNSGAGAYGVFPAPSAAVTGRVMELNMLAPVALTAALLPLLRERGGTIVNMASTAAFQPTPYLAVYGASKAFLLHWGLALNQELKGSGVRVLTVCPGPTRTGFFRAAGLADSRVRGYVQSPEAVAAATLRGLVRGSSLVVPGWPNKLGAALGGSLPKRWIAPIARLVLKSYRPPPEER